MLYNKAVCEYLNIVNREKTRDSEEENDAQS